MTEASQKPSKKDYWQEQISLYKQSGLRQQEFCIKKGLNYHQFKYWLERIKKMKQSNDKVSSNAIKPSQRISMIPVEVSNSLSMISSLAIVRYCTLEFNNQHRLIIEHPDALPLIEKLLLKIESTNV